MITTCLISNRNITKCTNIRFEKQSTLWLDTFVRNVSKCPSALSIIHNDRMWRFIVIECRMVWSYRNCFIPASNWNFILIFLFLYYTFISNRTFAIFATSLFQSFFYQRLHFIFFISIFRTTLCSVANDFLFFFFKFEYEFWLFDTALMYGDTRSYRKKIISHFLVVSWIFMVKKWEETRLT